MLFGKADMRYTLRQLEVFLAVASQESVSRAAESLAMSQSAVSGALADLERQFDIQLFERLGYTLPVMEAHVRYVRPARYDDLIVVDAILDAVRGASLRFRYDLRRGDELLADGWTEHACLGPRGRPTRLPDEPLAPWP